jgi:hypothetical protein
LVPLVLFAWVFLRYPHAVLWQNSSVTDLGSLGGALNNVALAINNQGQVVGDSNLPGWLIGSLASHRSLSSWLPIPFLEQLQRDDSDDGLATSLTMSS